MVDIVALASGSNGNCYYIGNKTEAVLIDAGIYFKDLIFRINQNNINPENIKAIFITHEHSDHVRGAKVLSKRLNIPVYFTSKTYYKLYEKYRPPYCNFFTPGDSIKLNSITIHSFLKKHDAVDPCSFVVESNNRRIGIFTDIGEACDKLNTATQTCDAIFLEANYDVQMLQNGPYPEYLKNRVQSEIGHLSNIQALNLINSQASDRLKLIFLSHLSEQNNTPELAMQAFVNLQKSIDIKLTSRYHTSELVTI